MPLTFSSPVIQQRISEWTSDSFDAATRREVQGLVDAGEVKELEERFYRTLEFGTGGLRGILGAGTNRMNPAVVAWATQGLANYVNAKAEKPGPLRAAIAHDCRHFSREFAECAAGVLAANGILVHLSPELRPTPYLSFAIRHLGCHTGIVVTASHNPKNYNGYKVYWDDGSQVVPPHDKGIIAEVAKITDNAQVRRMDVREGVAKGLIKIMGAEMDEAYLAAVLRQRQDADVIKRCQVSIAYTPLHGAGATLAVKALRGWGFEKVHPEEEQMKPDGDFPTAASPNPEEGAALGRAIELAKRVDGELVLATDPDADRLGIAVRHEGEFRLITGNQLCAMICDYVLRRRKEMGKLPPRPGVVTTIVTTPLFQQIAEHYGAQCPLVLTGFKWIARQIREWDAEGKGTEYLYGAEESYGYMIGNHARDKDGIVASCVTAEMAAWNKDRGMTLVDYLHELYAAHGVKHEWQKNITMPGADGAAKIAALMESIKSSPPKSFGGSDVVRITRVDDGTIRDGQTGAVTGKIDLPSSDVVLFDLANGSRAIARPSGTEPKIKFYFFLNDPKPVKDRAEVKTRLAALAARQDEFQAAFLKAIGVA